MPSVMAVTVCIPPSIRQSGRNLPNFTSNLSNLPKWVETIKEVLEVVSLCPKLTQTQRNTGETRPTGNARKPIKTPTETELHIHLREVEASLKEKLRLSSPGEETFYSDSSRNISVGLGESLVFIISSSRPVNESCYNTYSNFTSDI